MFLLAGFALQAEELIYRVDIRDDIGPKTWRLARRAFAEAEQAGADKVIVNMNTYGGMVVYADSLRNLKDISFSSEGENMLACPVTAPSIPNLFFRRGFMTEMSKRSSLSVSVSRLEAEYPPVTLTDWSPLVNSIFRTSMSLPLMSTADVPMFHSLEFSRILDGSISIWKLSLSVESRMISLVMKASPRFTRFPGLSYE